MYYKESAYVIIETGRASLKSVGQGGSSLAGAEAIVHRLNFFRETTSTKYLHSHIYVSV